MHKNICVYANDESIPREIFSQLFQYIGDQNLQLADSCKDDARQVSNTKLKLIHSLLSCYSIPVQIDLLESQLESFQKDSNDRGVSVMTSVFYKALFKSATAEE